MSDSLRDFAVSKVAAEVEAMIYASPVPVPAETIERLVPPGYPASEILRSIQSFYAGRGIELFHGGDGWQFKISDDVSRRLLAEDEPRGRALSDAALATLSIIMMHQPVTIGEIEKVRGIKLAKNVIDSLMDAGLIRAGIRKSGSGRAATFITTEEFLDFFGLEALSDMPTPEEARMMDLGSDQNSGDGDHISHP